MLCSQDSITNFPLGKTVHSLDIRVRLLLYKSPLHHWRFYIITHCLLSSHYPICHPPPLCTATLQE